MMNQSNLPFENNDLTIEKLMAGVVLLFVYFIPSIISRDKQDFKKIFALNLLTGWTFIGWLMALIWALKAKGNVKNKKKKEKKNKNTIASL